MDKRLADAWLNKAKPFDGMTHYSKQPLVASQMLDLLRTTLGWIQALGYRQLSYFDDWHFHDGHVAQSKAIDLVEMRGWLLSEQAMWSKISDDDLVSTASYPEDLAFLIRFGIAYPPDEEVLGSFDITISDRSLAPDLPSELLAVCDAVPASDFFASGHAPME